MFQHMLDHVVPVLILYQSLCRLVQLLHDWCNLFFSAVFQYSLNDSTTIGMSGQCKNLPKNAHTLKSWQVFQWAIHCTFFPCYYFGFIFLCMLSSKVDFLNKYIVHMYMICFTLHMHKLHVTCTLFTSSYINFLFFFTLITGFSINMYYRNQREKPHQFII